MQQWFFTFHHSESEHKHGVVGHLCDRFILRSVCNAVQGTSRKARWNSETDGGERNSDGRKMKIMCFFAIN